MRPYLHRHHRWSRSRHPGAPPRPVAATHLPAAGVEYYYYDQLGPTYSDQPDDPDLWQIDRFVDEVEQVRQALALDADNFFLYGHSWGGILAVEYALRYQEHLKGLVISNMMMGVPAYNRYAAEVLAPQMDQAALKEIRSLEGAGQTTDPAYEDLLMKHYYLDHLLRMPLEDWPDPVIRCFAHLNHPVYELMQGPSELGASGRLVGWDRSADLHRIEVPTLVIGAAHDTMDPEHMRRVANAIPHGRYMHCPQGSHMAMYDDQMAYMQGLVDFHVGTPAIPR